MIFFPAQGRLTIRNYLPYLMTMPELPLENINSALTKRLMQVVDRVNSAEKRFNRKPGSVLILPVSKTRPPEDIAQVAKSGFDAFGESYLQEAEKKISQLASLHLQWHFIGPIQSNKTQLIANLFHWVHSVDREKILRRLNDQRPDHLPPLNICLQVNISGEATKSGISPDEVTDLASRVLEFPRLRLRGIMAIPAPSEDFEKQRQVFRQVNAIFTHLQTTLANTEALVDTLSMGMSRDLEAAIAEGSTLVRIGTDIFGPRN